MKETTKQYIRLSVLLVIVIGIIFYEPISSGRFFQASEKFEDPLSIMLDGIKYTFSKDLTVTDFENNGWALYTRDYTEGRYTNIDTKLILPKEGMTLLYTKTVPYTPTGDITRKPKNGMIYLYIRNTSTEPLPYTQCKCIGIETSDYIIDFSIYLPRGITFGDSYGRVESAYRNGQRLKPFLEYINPRLRDSGLLYYKFDNSNFRVSLDFYCGRLGTFELKEFEEDK